MYKSRSTEVLRVYSSTVHMPLAGFLQTCETESVKDYALPIYQGGIGNEAPRVPFSDILTHWAHHSDKDAADGPFIFLATRDGVVFGVNETIQSAEKAFEGAVREYVHGGQRVRVNDMPSNQIVAAGALYFGRHADYRLNEDSVIIDCTHLG